MLNGQSLSVTGFLQKRQKLGKFSKDEITNTHPDILLLSGTAICYSMFSLPVMIAEQDHFISDCASHVNAIFFHVNSRQMLAPHLLLRLCKSCRSRILPKPHWEVQTHLLVHTLTAQKLPLLSNRVLPLLVRAVCVCMCVLVLRFALSFGCALQIVQVLTLYHHRDSKFNASPRTLLGFTHWQEDTEVYIR